MNKSTRLIVTSLALAGLYTGSLALKANAASADSGKPAAKEESGKASCSGKDGCKGKDTCKGKDSCKGKHDCKGKNACKGEGGCNSGDNGCKGKNSCKGKGGCATKAAEPAPKEGAKDK